MSALHLPPARTTASSRIAGWKNLGIGVIIAFTVKGLITGSLLVLMLLGFIQF